TESVDTAAAPERNYRKTLRGVVVSDKMDKTIIVEIEYFKQHALYGKIMRRTKRVKAHDEQNTAGIGDSVRLAETRPLSKSKNWRLTNEMERVNYDLPESNSNTPNGIPVRVLLLSDIALINPRQTYVRR